MNPGQTYHLMPFSQQIEASGSREKLIYKEVFMEAVTFIRLSWTDNAVIKDRQGRYRLCNVNDLVANEPAMPC
ncbi:hypothetical protein [Mucilaginibacter paludis]|uniref:Uncharacterized protein n=1 Tax=Mucilaginibacter paludis DSM 18603 TaxID=714943 RepID=H1YH55_9SPHI|nr:hypothetical protein [Mucilaginibacter paludis]EHQ24557.1 hypothetical protein Mucpa_0361 [Mucilaginibacter paludis DSM 18603]